VKVGAIAQRENRWVLVDITGKGNRVRSVAVPAWVKAAIDEWTTAAGITEGKIFRVVRKGGKIWGQDLTPGAVLQLVQQYAREMGLEKLAPHDMRRTCAKLCRKRGGDLGACPKIVRYKLIPKAGGSGKSSASPVRGCNLARIQAFSGCEDQ
jgi:integrase